MKVLIATVQVPFVRGGAELLAEQLRGALLQAGHEADIVAIPFKWYPPERILDSILTCRLTDLINVSGTNVDRLIGIKFPAYVIPHPNKVLWIAHQHRTAYDLWASDYCDLRHYPNGPQVRLAIMKADRSFIPEARAVYTISQNVSNRLRRFCGIESESLYPPLLDACEFYSRGSDDYFLAPSRISVMKRQALIVEALAKSEIPTRVKFLGAPDESAHFDALKKRASELGVSPRVEWLGRVSDTEKYALYAGARGVIFVPVDEDYGYVTLEAMLSRKPVITCEDSGGPLEFVQNGITGITTCPTPEGLAAAMDALWTDPCTAERMGEAGREAYEELNMSWGHVLERLLQ